MNNSIGPKDYYSWRINLRAMFETIGSSYPDREYIMSNDGKFLRWLFIPDGYWNITNNLYFKCFFPDTFYYSVGHIMWKSADYNSYYKSWTLNVKMPAKRKEIAMVCNANYSKMLYATDCAIDLDSHDDDVSYQTNVDRTKIITEKVVSELDKLNLGYILYYSGRGFGIRIPYNPMLEKVTTNPAALGRCMKIWVDKLAEKVGEFEGAKVDNIMTPKRYSKVPYSLIQYPGLTTYAKRIKAHEIEKFIIPEPERQRGQHRDFEEIQCSKKFVGELAKIHKSLV